MRERRIGTPSGRWSIGHFSAFWSAPSVERIRTDFLADDMAGYWPFAARPVGGAAEYAQRVAELLALVPDLRLEVAEYASSGTGDGEVHFIRWVASGTPPVGPSSWSGVDRLLARDGVVFEHRIHSDHPVFLLVTGSRDRIRP